MKLTYEDLLSGVPIPVEKIATFRSPQLKELTPQGIGMSAYNLYLSILSWEKEDFLQHIHPNQATILTKNEKLNLFDMMAVLKDGFREILHQALDFFVAENIKWDKSKNCFLTFRLAKENEAGDNEGQSLVGEINRENFSEVCDMILQLNYMSKGKEQSLKPMSKKAKERLEKIQKFKKENKSKTDDRYRLGNIISKICADSKTYNFLNIYQLTVFQLYDLFSQFSFMRSTTLSERIYSNHGGDKFKYEDWLKPINNL